MKPSLLLKLGVLSNALHHYTPKHGSWAGFAEIELSILKRQCLDRRIADQETLSQEIDAWENSRNAKGGTINWRFTTQDARIDSAVFTHQFRLDSVLAHKGFFW